MADAYQDLVVDVTRRSSVDDFPTNAPRITRTALRYLNERLRFEEMVKDAAIEATEDGRVNFTDDIKPIAIRNVVTGYYLLAPVSSVNLFSGYKYVPGNDYFDTSEASTMHEFEYFERIKDPSDAGSVGFDLLAFNYDLFLNAVLFYALRDANRYEDAGPVSELLGGTIDRLELNSSLERYRDQSIPLSYGKGYTP